MKKTERLRMLLERGYFPDELPPPFTTANLAKFRASLKKAWQPHARSYPRAKLEIFSVPRIRGARRNLSITNPIAQFYLSDLIADNWVTIKKHIDENSLSVDHVQIANNHRRSIDPPDFDQIRRRTLEISAEHNATLFADISIFYGTIYTHAIAWSLHSKDWCKTNEHDKLKSSLGNKLDRAIRKCQDGQSIGIPIGPDTSRIISEIIAVAIDNVAQKNSSINKTSSFRNVDDYIIGLERGTPIDSVISDLSRACREYELELNSLKTQILGAEHHADTIWPSEIREFNFVSLAGSRRQGDRIEHFFAKAFDLSSKFLTGNVIDYALKRTKSLTVRREYWSIYENWILKSVRANITTLPAAVEIIASYNSDKFDLNKTKIQKFIEEIIETHAPPGHHAEVAWALFLAKSLRLRLGKIAADAIAPLESSICALLALDLKARDLWSAPLDVSVWTQSMSDTGLESRMWLLSYEAQIKGWLNKGGIDHVSKHRFFCEIQNRAISFYDVDSNVKHIRPRQRLMPAHVPPPFSAVTSSMLW